MTESKITHYVIITKARNYYKAYTFSYARLTEADKEANKGSTRGR